MEPMKPMKPMEPMKPMADVERWWPEDLGPPSSSGSQNGWRYAFFQKPRRLVIDQEGKITTFDSGEHVINGVAQAGGASTPTFSTSEGPVNLGDLKRLT